MAFEKNKGFFSRLKEGLKKTRENFTAGIATVLSTERIDEDFYDRLEEALITGDIGVEATDTLLMELREKVETEYITDGKLVRRWLVRRLQEVMAAPEDAYLFEEERSVILVVGVNGVGKTTTIGKLAGQYVKQGKRVVIAAADTFRAAAGPQLKEWADRAGAELITGAEGADPASVVYDAVGAMRARDADVLLVDTAGRLHNKKNLMAELAKINRIVQKEFPDLRRETLVVCDATTGQNALEQARQFQSVTDLTGVILTKMDGTARGGIAIAIQSECKVPVKFIGVGEGIDDLQRFDPEAFVSAIFEM